MKNTRIKRTIATFLFLTMIAGLTLFFIVDKGYANSNTKTMKVTIGEGEVDIDNLSKVINIPYLKEIVNVTSNTGNVTYNVDGDNVTLNASGGNPSRSVNNPQKYSKTVTDYSTSGANSFSATKSYNSGGYSGTLSKNGSSYVISGSYTPADSKYVTESIEVVVSGSSPSYPPTITYNNQGYSGTLYFTKETRTSRVGKPGDYTDTYRIDYDGTVARPESDTRLYRQDYSGTVYMLGYDNYYIYEITITYIDNSDPILNLATPGSTTIINNDKYFILSGTVTDTDEGQTVTISATIDGKTKTQSILSPVSNEVWALNWKGSELADGSYSNIIIMADDNQGGTASETYTGTIMVDKTNPTAPLISANEHWTNNNVDVNIIAGTDSGSGVDKTEYSLSGATTLDWITIETGGNVTILNEGQTTVKARTIDKADNISTEVSKIIKIDKTKPKIKITIGN